MFKVLAFVLSMTADGQPSTSFVNEQPTTIAQRYECWVRVGPMVRPCTRRELQQALRETRRTRARAHAERRRARSELERDMEAMDRDLEEGEREFRRDMREFERDMRELERETGTR